MYFVIHLWQTNPEQPVAHIAPQQFSGWLSATPDLCPCLSVLSQTHTSQLVVSKSSTVYRIVYAVPNLRLPACPSAPERRPLRSLLASLPHFLLLNDLRLQPSESLGMKLQDIISSVCWKTLHSVLQVSRDALQQPGGSTGGNAALS
jgi:hypothetical protein